MKQYLRNVLKNAARWYKPIDKHFLKNRHYRVVSDTLYDLYFKTVYRHLAAYLKYLRTTEVDPSVVLFETFWGRKISCNPYAIYRAMLADARFDHQRFVWIKTMGAQIPADVASNPRVTLVERDSDAYQHALSTAGTLVNNTTFPPYFLRRPEQKYINTYHGIPLKKMGFDIDDTLTSIGNTQRNFIQATHLLSGGDYTDTHLYKPYGAWPLFKERVVHTGFPRIDLTQAEPKQDLLSALGVSGEKPVVLFAPTWRGKAGTLEAEVQGLIESVKALYGKLSAEFDVVVSLHNLVLAKAENLPARLRLLPPELDVNEVMSVVDVLISDYSSILVDYLVLDRPLVLFVPDRVQYAEERGLYVSLDDLPGSICETIDDVILATKNAKKPSEFSEQFGIVDQLAPLQDGLATARVLDEIYKPLAEPSPHERKRVLLNMNALGHNGITTSFLNLTHTLDHDAYDVFVLMDARALDASPDDLSYFYKIHPRCHRILRVGTSMKEKEERITIRSLSDPEIEIPTEMKRTAASGFKREARRVLSDAYFDGAVDFAGYSPFWANLISSLNAKQKVIFQHNDLYAEHHNPEKSHEKLVGVFRSYDAFDVIAPVSKEVGEINFNKLRAFYRSESQVQPVRNTIDVDAIRQRADEPLALACPQMALCQDVPALKLVTLGRLSVEKNHARLIKAFALARGRGLNAILFIAGTGLLEKELVALAAKLNVSDRVIFVGQIGNPYPFLKAADLFVLSSDYEGQPMTLLEALSLGVECLGTDIPGIRAVLGDRFGQTVPPTAQDLADAFLSVAGKKSNGSEEKFDAQAYLDTVVGEFENVIFRRMP